MNILLEVQGVLSETLPGVFRDRLPLILSRHRADPILMFVTTRVGSIEDERRSRRNDFLPARGEAPAQFTWKESGLCDSVVRRFRLEFLRHLGPADQQCTIYFQIALVEDAAGLSPVRSERANSVPATPAQVETSRAAAPFGPVPVAFAAAEPAEDERTAVGLATARIIDAATASPETHPDAQTAPQLESELASSFLAEQAPAETAASQASPAARPGKTALPGNLYVDWFGFERMPFNNTPDPRFFFPTEKHQEALSRLIYAISERKGFVLISGEIGSGKSTLCRTLLAQLPGTVKTALITHTHVDSDQLVRAIAEDLDLDVAGRNKMEVLQAINAYLIEQLAAGATVCILIDEAQHLSPAALEEVRMISNLETEEEKLVQLILLGQPELRDKIRLPEMLQLRQRIAVQYHLLPLARNETIDYIAHRIRVAAPSEALVFKRAAMIEVFRRTAGVPRLINILCDNALLTAYTREKRTITAGLIREAARDLDLHPSRGGLRAFFEAW